MGELVAITLIVSWVTAIITGVVIIKTEYGDHKEWFSIAICTLCYLSLTAIFLLSLVIPIVTLSDQLVGWLLLNNTSLQ